MGKRFMKSKCFILIILELSGIVYPNSTGTKRQALLCGTPKMVVQQETKPNSLRSSFPSIGNFSSISWLQNACIKKCRLRRVPSKEKGKRSEEKWREVKGKRKRKGESACSSQNRKWRRERLVANGRRSSRVWVRDCHQWCKGYRVWLRRTKPYPRILV